MYYVWQPGKLFYTHFDIFFYNIVVVFFLSVQSASPQKRKREKIPFKDSILFPLKNRTPNSVCSDIQQVFPVCYTFTTIHTFIQKAVNVL